MAQCDRLKSVLLQEVVQVLTEHFEHQASVSAMTETFERPDHVERAGILLAKSQKDRDFDLALARVRRVILQYLNGHNVVASVPPAFNHLTERSLAQELQNLYVTTWHALQFTTRTTATRKTRKCGN